MQVRLEIQILGVKQVVEDRYGKLAIPEVQRAYVWGPDRTPKLLDPIYMHHRISAAHVLRYALAASHS